MDAKGKPMFDQIYSELNVAFIRIGSYLLAFSEEEITKKHEEVLRLPHKYIHQGII